MVDRNRHDDRISTSHNNWKRFAGRYGDRRSGDSFEHGRIECERVAAGIADYEGDGIESVTFRTICKMDRITNPLKYCRMAHRIERKARNPIAGKSHGVIYRNAIDKYL